MKNLFYLALISALLISCEEKQENLIEIHAEDHIALIGNNLASRMMNYGYFETELHARYPDSLLTIRNMADGGNTPGFRPHSGRNSPWAYDSASIYFDQLANPSGSVGHLNTPDEWLTEIEANIVLAFFGYNESFNGPEGLVNFRDELNGFIEHTLNQKYNGSSNPQLVLVSPIAFEDLTHKYDLPDGTKENENLKIYSEAMREVANMNGIPFVDSFGYTTNLYQQGEFTVDGFQLSEEGYKKFTSFLATELTGIENQATEEQFSNIHAKVQEKNWFWHNYYKIPNGVHVFGRRYDPFGPDNYPYELEKLRQMTTIRDTAIWETSMSREYDVSMADKNSLLLPPVQTNYVSGDYGRGQDSYKYGEDALATMKTAPGYKIELFASEEQFPDLANPAQLSFDDKGRLWVAVMPSYPHYKPGDSKPNDKLIILEDTDGDGKADNQITFADGLHLPIGFELSEEGVYVSQGTNLILYSDTDGDDQADKKDILLSGFDDHDTHHAISAFTTDPSGAIYMAEGVFLHTNVETPYGPVRGTNGGFYRYNPNRKHLERTAQLPIPNPWGIAFDPWGQPFFLDTSGPALRWMLPGTLQSIYGVSTTNPSNLVPEKYRVRPTSGLEFVSSSHFPDEVQGDVILGNAIGFLGVKQHKVIDSGTGYELEYRQDLLWSTDQNFRPVDLEFAPDGSLYVVDWHNVLIGHMQHNARDPLRDHVHGRIYRVTYPSRPLVTPAKVEDASIVQLLENLKEPELRTRYRSRRELRGRDPLEVQESLKTWLGNLDNTDPRIDQYKLEALWVTWGLNQIDSDLLSDLIESVDYRVRAGAVRAIRYNIDKIPSYLDLLKAAAKDEHGRVRMEVITTASWLEYSETSVLLDIISESELDDWLTPVYLTARAHMEGKSLKQKTVESIPEHLNPELVDIYLAGKEIYLRDGHCNTCHQPNGNGLPLSGFPPLAGSKWVMEDDERLIKLTLKGLMGPITVLGQDYPGTVPMTPFEGMLTDKEVASVLTYIRNSFGNKGKQIDEILVKKIRDEFEDKKDFFTPEELLKTHPMN